MDENLFKQHSRITKQCKFDSVLRVDMIQDMPKKSKKSMTIEDLAEMMQRTMASKEDITQLRTELRTEMQDRFTKVEKKMEDGFYAVNRRIDLLHEDLSDLPDIRDTMKDHEERLTRVERKVGSPK
jgi:tRNA U34 5-carboxymethylaminomethyl modifying GTPase MnmE/TrmE